MTKQAPDIIDRIVGIAPGSHLDEVRALRPEARQNAQKSYSALFEAESPGDVSPRERFAVATFVAGLHRQPAVTAFYASLLEEGASAEFSQAVETEIGRGAGQGPYGKFPEGRLSTEDVDGPVYRVPDDVRVLLGPKLAAAFEHAHLLVFHPRDASPEHLQSLLDAGWSTDGIVTLSQLISFLAFQVRVIAGLHALDRNGATRAAQESALASTLATGANL